MNRSLFSLSLILGCVAGTMLSAQTPLPILPLDTGMVFDGIRRFELKMGYGTTQFIPAGAAGTIGYNGGYFGPVLRFIKGETVSISVENGLNEPSTTHWHGLHVPAIMDGGPHQIIPAGITWTATYPVLNNAATYWYHPHLHTSSPLDSTATNTQIYRGLAGMILIEDEVSRGLALPRTYGVDDIPMTVQDKSFNDDGSLSYTSERRHGDHFLVNGVVEPRWTTHAQMIRIRILNGSNARFFNFGFSDDRSFHQIASDGGFLSRPVEMNRLLLAAGERAEIVVDFGNDVGKTLELHAYNSENGGIVGEPDRFDTTDFPIMTIAVGEATENPVRELPEILTTIKRYTLEDADNKDNPRPFVFADGPGTAMNINGQVMNMNVINETIPLGATEVWELGNTDDEAHPMHIHGEPFQIISRNGAPPPENEQGWKDVAIVYPNEKVLIVKNFPLYADPVNPYMYHCHILFHEGSGMMGQFVVVDTATSFVEADNPSGEGLALGAGPHPVTDRATVYFNLPRSGHIQLTLYNRLGQEVMVLAEGWYEAGEGRLDFNAEGLGNGLYFYRLATEGGHIVGRVIVNR